MSPFNDTIFSTNFTDEMFHFYFNKAEIYGELCDLILIISLTFLVNIIVLLALYKFKNLQTISNVFVANLAVVDIQKAIFPYPLAAVEIFNGPLLSKRKTLCGIQYFFIAASQIISLYTLRLLSINRYVMIVKSHYFSILFTVRNVNLMLLLFWILTVFLGMCPLIGIGHIRYYLEAGLCIFKYDVYPLILVIIVYIIPILIIFFCNQQIFNIAISSGKRLVKDKHANGKTDQQEARQQKEIKLAKTLLIIVFTFFCLYTPSVAVAFLKINYSVEEVIFPRWVVAIALHIWASSSWINPFILYITNKDFKNGFQEVCPILKKLYFWKRLQISS